MKTCSKCREAKRESDFTRNATKPDGLDVHCRACKRTRNRHWRDAHSESLKQYYADYRAAHPNHGRDSHLKRKYGLGGVAAFDSMLVTQGGRCAICGTDKPGGAGTFSVDHDHTTGAVRGLLCTNCNQGIGHLKDDIAILQAALEYLKRFSSKRAA
jgi:hypothetical protein